LDFFSKHPLFIPLSIAGGLALIGIAELPYAYYEFLRWVLVAASVLLAVYSWNSNQKGWVIAAIPIFILWFPPFQIYMDKSAWVILDLIAGITLIISGASISSPAAKQSK
jgi:hypothetical protein